MSGVSIDDGLGRLRYVDDFLHSNVGKAFPGAVALVSVSDKIRYLKGYGKAQTVPIERSLDNESVFDVASLTKPLVTSTLIMQLVEEGVVNLDDPVTNILPEFSETNTGISEEKKHVRVWHLLTHTSGLPEGLPLYEYTTSREMVITEALKCDMVFEPGTRVLYSDLGFIVLTAAIEKLCGRRIDKLFEDRVVKPLGLNSTSFNPSTELRGRIVATEHCKWRKRVLVGEVHDENAYAMAGVSGHAGLFTSAAEAAEIVRSLFFSSKPLISPASYKAMTSNWTSGFPERRGLVWRLQDRTMSSPGGQLMPESSFGHTGFTGTSIWVEPVSKTIAILFTNRVHPDRNNDLILGARQIFHNIVASAVVNRF